MKKCIAVYLRLSQEDVDKRTNKAKDDSNSIMAQRQLIQRYIEQNPYLAGLPQMEFCDDGFTGTNFERPDFQRMIDMVRNGEIHIIIVKDLSRFGRDYLEVGDYLEHIFPFLGVRMISVNDRYDSEKYAGNTAGMDIAFKNLIYDYYSKDLSKKVKTAMRTKQKSGSYVTCCTYGYKVSPRNKHQMVIDPETAPVVRRIFQDVIAGKSTTQVAKDLNAEGVPTPSMHKGTKRRETSAKNAIWTHQRIITTIQNVKYTGTMVNNLRESTKIRAKSQRRVPEEEWIIHENAHEAIVSKEEFEAANASLKQVSYYHRNSERKGFPFVCAHCGRKLQRTNGVDKYFYCSSTIWNDGDEACKSVRWNKANIEEVVFEALKAQIAVMTLEARCKTQTSETKGTRLRKRLKALAADLQAGDTQKVQSYIDYREGRITREDFISLRAEREKRMAELKDEIAAAEAEYEAFLAAEEQAEKERAIVEQTSSMDDEALKEIMYDAVDQVLVTDSQTIEIVWKFDDLFVTA